MEEIIKKLKKELSIYKLILNARGFSSVKRQAKILIPEYEKAIDILEKELSKTTK
jgi:hypothetical protein